MSPEQKKYLKTIKKKKVLILFLQVFLLVFLLGLWQIAADLDLINTFIFSSPSRVMKTIISLYQDGSLFHHLWVTFYETVFSFLLGTFLGIFIATILWWFRLLAKVLEPYFTVLNSLPKVALGPIILIWFGASIRSIIFMAMLISVVVAILNIYQGFQSVDPEKIKLMRSFHAKKWQICMYLIFPSNRENIMATLKLNISMCLIGV